MSESHSPFNPLGKSNHFPFETSGTPDNDHGLSEVEKCMSAIVFTHALHCPHPSTSTSAVQTSLVWCCSFIPTLRDYISITIKPFSFF